MACENIKGCPFFNDRLDNMPALASMYKKNYCEGEYEKCARYVVCKKLGKEGVPDNLFPNQMDKAMEILEKASK